MKFPSLNQFFVIFEICFKHFVKRLVHRKLQEVRCKIYCKDRLLSSFDFMYSVRGQGIKLGVIKLAVAARDHVIPSAIPVCYRDRLGPGRLMAIKSS